MIFPRRSLLLSLTASALLPAAAEVRLPHVFTDGAVLQRDRAVPVWGTAEAGKKVIVKFAGQEKSVQAAADGKWRIDLDAMPVSAEGRVLEAADLAALAAEGCSSVVVAQLEPGELDENTAATYEHIIDPGNSVREAMCHIGRTNCDVAGSNDGHAAAHTVRFRC